MSNNKNMSKGKYYKKLLQLLENSRVVEKGCDFTHMSMNNPRGKFLFKSKKKFMRYYQNALEEGHDLHILERHKDYGPLLFDIDIKYESETGERTYTDEDLENVVKKYMKYVIKYFDINLKNSKDLEKLNVYITEKEKPTFDNGICKDGFHGIFPNICARKEIQYIIREGVLNEFKKDELFSKLNPTNSYEDIFDKAVICRNGWMLYGSFKPNCLPYKLTHIYGWSDNDFIEYDLDSVDFDTLPQFFSIRKFVKKNITKFNENYSEKDISNIFEEYNKQNNLTYNKVVRTIQYDEDDIRKAKELVKLLSIKRAEEFEPWIELGFCLHNISDELLEDWDEFSSQSPKYKYGDCQERWRGFRSNAFTLSSLFFWAKNDNPEGFEQFMNKEIDSLLQKAINGTSGCVAKVFYMIYEYDYVCASIKNNTWFEFKDHRWNIIEEGYTIYNKLNDEIPKYFDKLVKKYTLRKNNELNDAVKKTWDKQIEEISKVSNKLKTDGFKKQIINELRNMYYDKDFYNNLDENRDLLGFKNGVLDLRNEIFRDGKPEDYLSNSTNINYIEYDPKNKKIKEVQKFFREVQPDEEVRNYVLDLFCSCLQGHTPDEKFHIWTGSGGNGKSQCVSLFQKSMGDYATTLPITLLTGKRPSATAANPELAKCKGVRFAVFQEPENDDKIHVGHMKEITGNDKISARGLYKEPVEFYPQFKTLLTCNKLPRIPSSDGGTWRRLRVVPFEMVFCENPKAPNERKMDKKLKEKLDGWTEAFLSILFNERFKIYKKNDFKIKEPFKVTECTTAYQKRSDLILEFANEHLEKTDNKKDKIQFSTVWNEFKAWFREAHTEIKLPSRTEFRDDFSEKFGKINKNFWSGVMFKKVETTNSNVLDSDSDSDDSSMTMVGNNKIKNNNNTEKILRAL